MSGGKVYWISDIQREEKSVHKAIKEAAKRIDIGSAKALAKEVVLSRRTVNRLYENKAQLNSISMNLGESVQMNVSWRQEKLRAFCNEKGIRLSAWSLLAANGTAWGSLAVMESPILKGIALARGKTLPQVALTWLHQHGVTPIVKSFNKERMKQNFQFLGWQLTKEGLEKIKQIPLVTGFSGERFVHKEGPCKTIEEFWA